MQRGEGGLLHQDEPPVRLILMQDNAPAHTAATTMCDLQERQIEVMVWPPYSPDLNPIEWVWNWMKDYQDQTYGGSVAGPEKEGRQIMEAWEQAVTVERLVQLVDQMPGRIEAVIAAGGGQTRY
jgi:hypothetical protein